MEFPDDGSLDAELLAELTNDPAGIGYASMDKYQVEEAINSTTGTGSVLFPRHNITSTELIQQVIMSEFVALPATYQNGWAMMTSPGILDAGHANTVAQAEFIWGTGSQTWANFSAIAERRGSRAEFLWGEEMIVRHWHIGRVRG